MAYDPSLPLDSTLATAAQMRGQLTGLKDLIDAGVPGPAGPAGEVTVADLMAALVAERPNHAKNPTGVAALGITISDPPTQFEVQTIVSWGNILLAELQRQP